MSRKWTNEECNVIKELYETTPIKDIAVLLNRSGNSIKNKARKLRIYKTSENLHRFPKGFIPHNKGVKMPKDVYEKVKRTMFKKGNIPHNALLPFQEVQRNEKGKIYIMIKLPNEKRLKYKHHFIWEQQNGKIPKGHNIVFKDGNQFNCIIENLECITNAELMRRNTIHRFPKELKETIFILRKLNKTIQNIESDGKTDNNGF